MARDRASQKASHRARARRAIRRGNPALVALAKSLWDEGRTLLATSALVAEGTYDGDRAAVLGGAGQAPDR